MKKYIIAVTATVLLTNTQTASATDSSIDEYRYDMIKQNVVNSLTADNHSILIDGTEVYVSYTAWSDTSPTLTSEDDRVVSQGELDYSGYHYGYALDNLDKTYGDSHTIDNFQTGEGIPDFDMVLFSFSESVTLTDTTFKYLIGSGSENQVTTVGFNDISLFENASSTQFTWADAASQSSAISSIFNGNISASPSGKGNYSVTYEGLTEAKYWLVGSYNTFFDETTNASDISGSGFKLSSLGFSIQDSEAPGAPTSVHEPGVFGLMLISIGILAWRRKRAA